MAEVKRITNFDNYTMIPEPDKEQLRKIQDKFSYRLNDYYVNLIQWEDPKDPIRKLLVTPSEILSEYGMMDAKGYSLEQAPGCMVIYRTTALLSITEDCGAETLPGLKYIAANTEINSVIITGADSFRPATERLHQLLSRLRDMKHVHVIRLRTKMTSFNPKRISEDMELLYTLHDFSTPEQRIYISNHVNHPRELTTDAIRAFRALHDAGVILNNQTPILKGVNDDPVVLAELLDKLSGAGVTPYDFFVNRQVKGNHEFVLPLEEVYQIVEEAKYRTVGSGKGVRLSINHRSGKMEIMAINQGKAYLKYYRSRNDQEGILILDCPPGATELDELQNDELARRKLQRNAATEPLASENSDSETSSEIGVL
ncbi:hypothetical protein SY83_03440 [Paenibacillus swuensis]|uniref:KamA family radical SAM protein n=1 Tax=Paenibacillus swuensis TaxID=1178515 RepID=A0A172TEZ0_9BACL|nr:hypothetical protein [Paenibacillus swuensis]ANE45522.1 hypothetical protein SY83_03440 [Paenibacillus swuensis]